jgi:hypothetical protein
MPTFVLFGDQSSFPHGYDVFFVIELVAIISEKLK